MPALKPIEEIRTVAYKCSSPNRDQSSSPPPPTYKTEKNCSLLKSWWRLTLHLLTWRIWWAPNKASKGQMGFNSAFKGLNFHTGSHTQWMGLSAWRHFLTHWSPSETWKMPTAKGLLTIRFSISCRENIQILTSSQSGTVQCVPFTWRIPRQFRNAGNG